MPVSEIFFHQKSKWRFSSTNPSPHQGVAVWSFLAFMKEMWWKRSWERRRSWHLPPLHCGAGGSCFDVTLTREGGWGCLCRVVGAVERLRDPPVAGERFNLFGVFHVCQWLIRRTMTSLCLIDLEWAAWCLVTRYWHLGWVVLALDWAMGGSCGGIFIRGLWARTISHCWHLWGIRGVRLALQLDRGDIAVTCVEQRSLHCGCLRVVSWRRRWE